MFRLASMTTDGSGGGPSNGQQSPRRPGGGDGAGGGGGKDNTMLANFFSSLLKDKDNRKFSITKAINFNCKFTKNSVIRAEKSKGTIGRFRPS
jgi:hypothetical protein